MRWILATALAVIAAGSAVAGDKTAAPGHNGLTVGHDGKMWRMEGCAAYPVEAHAGGQSKPVAAAAVTPPATPEDDEGPAKLATSDKPAE